MRLAQHFSDEILSKRSLAESGVCLHIDYCCPWRAETRQSKNVTLALCGIQDGGKSGHVLIGDPRSPRLLLGHCLGQQCAPHEIKLMVLQRQ